MFSQTTVSVNSSGDTILCFSVKQAKFLLKEHYRANKFQQLDSLCNIQLQYFDSVVKSNGKQIVIYDSLVKNREEVIALKDKQVETLTEELNKAYRATRRQKTYKILAIISGSSLSAFLGYKYLTK